MILKNKINIFYLLCALIILMESYYLLTYVPKQWSEVLLIRDNYVQKSKEVSILDRALKILESTDKVILAKQLEKVSAAIPSQKKTSGLVNGLISIASNSGVILNQLDFSPGNLSTESAQLDEQVIGKSNARSIDANLVVSTDMNKFLTMLDSIQKTSQLLGIKRFGFSKLSRSGTQASIDLKVYFEPLSEVPINWEAVRPITPDEQKILDSLSLQDNFIIPEERR